MSRRSTSLSSGTEALGPPPFLSWDCACTLVDAGSSPARLLCTEPAGEMRADLWSGRTSITWRLKWLWRLKCNFQLKGMWHRGWGCCQWGQREEFCTVGQRAPNRQQNICGAAGRGSNTYSLKAWLQSRDPKGCEWHSKRHSALWWLTSGQSEAAGLAEMLPGRLRSPFSPCSRTKPGNTLGYESPRGQAVLEMAGSKAHKRDCSFWETPN